MFLSTVNSSVLGHSAAVHSQLLQLNACVCIGKPESTVIRVLKRLKNQVNLKLLKQHFTRLTLINITL